MAQSKNPGTEKARNLNIKKIRKKRKANEVTLKDLAPFFLNKNGNPVTQGFMSMIESGYPASSDTISRYNSAVDAAIELKKSNNKQ